MKFICALPLIACFCCLSVHSTEKKQDKNEMIVSQNKSQKKSSVIQEAVLGMNISGNKELPNVLYIVPWKSNKSFSKPATASRLVDEIYALVDPDAFSKKVLFYQQLTKKEN